MQMGRSGAARTLGPLLKCPLGIDHYSQMKAFTIMWIFPLKGNAAQLVGWSSHCFAVWSRGGPLHPGRQRGVAGGCGHLCISAATCCECCESIRWIICQHRRIHIPQGMLWAYALVTAIHPPDFDVSLLSNQVSIWLWDSQIFNISYSYRANYVDLLRIVFRW